MRGKEYNAVVYSEYSGDTVFDEKDRCLMKNIMKEGVEKEGWCVSTYAEEGTEVKLDTKAVKKSWETIERGNLLQTVWTAHVINELGLKKQNEEDIRGISVLDPSLSRKQLKLSKGNYLEILKYKNKGEEKLLKIIVKNKETGEQKCIDISKKRENDSDIKALKVGMTVYYLEKVGQSPKLVEIVKIVDERVIPNSNPWTYLRDPGGFQSFLDDLIQQNEAREERKKYRERPYFNVKIDPIPGKSDGKENLEKMKFPCWVTYKYREDGKHRIGMLVTGFPNNILEYQLIDMMEQVSAKNCCTSYRDIDLEKLMKKCYIEVIKGETQLWRVGKFNV